MHTHQKGLKAFWRMPISDKKYVTVFIWENKNAMHIVNPEIENKIGYCRTMRWVQNYEKTIRKCGKKFAELHFVYKFISISLVAHELFHLTNYWSQFNWWDSERDDEKMAMVNESLTKIFWENYLSYDIQKLLLTKSQNVVK